MSERFPPLDLEDGLGRQLEEDIEKHYGSGPKFKWKDGKGALIGPFAVVSYTPDLFRPWMVLADAVLQQKDLEPRSRELACLAVAAVYDVPYMRYAHQRIGVKVGLTPDQVSLAVEGVVPEGLSDTEVIVYVTAFKLARARGPLDEEIWAEAESKLGKVGAARVGHVVAWYVYNSTLLKLGAVDVPAD